jgi:hypothetical protein
MTAAARIDIPTVARAALPHARVLVERWAPGGRLHGAEYVARNPTRSDSRPGSFKINIASGRWADFATGDRGGDLVSLAAYLNRISQVDAARRIAAMLGLKGGQGDA